MLVFKFGGASVKDSNGVKNLLNIVSTYSDNLIVVISALGKTTNALEEILKLSYQDMAMSLSKVDDLKKYHFQIIDDLFTNKEHKIFDDIAAEFNLMINKLTNEKYDSYDVKYDQIVSYGEIVSTKIISAFLNWEQLTNQWIDIRKVLKTDDTYREAKIDFELTQKESEKTFDFKDHRVFITQGFIGGSKKGLVTTLGREGSDYTAAVLANLLNAKKVVVWKDVEGILNADPQFFKETKKLDKLSYQEAVELAYFGAKVIHPKTLKPLHNKNIPLYVRSFINPEGKGTEIDCFKAYDQNMPVFVLKKEQMLISLFPKDLSFVLEDELSRIFKYLSDHRIKVNIIQNSAISISFCIDNANSKSKKLIEKLKEDYKVLYNDQLELLTIRHYSEEAIREITRGRKVFIEQRSRHTAHFVMK